MTVGTTKRGSEYARCKLTDAQGAVAAKMWDYKPELGGPLLKTGAIVLVEGLVEEYLGAPDIKITKVSLPMAAVDPSDYEKRSKFDEVEMWDCVQAYMEQFDNRWFRAVAKDIFGQGDYAERFRLGPAATGMHHAYKHGLLEHTLEMLQMGDGLLKLPFLGGNLNRDLCLFGILFHDFGKIFEYSSDAGYSKTVEGTLVPHIPMVGAMIYETCQRLGVPALVRDYMMHVVLAHHREIAWGSPVSFACPEAAFVHYIDNMHGDIFGMLQRVESSKEEIVRHASYRVVAKPFADILKECEVQDEGIESISRQAALVDGF